MAQGWNACFHKLQPLSSDSRSLNVPLDSEESLAHHLESLIEHNDMSNTVASPEKTSDLNMSSSIFSNSNTSSEFVQQKYFDDVLWQDEGQPAHHGDLFKHTSNSLFALDRPASSSHCLSDSGEDLNSHDLKQKFDLLKPSIPEEYSDVSSCSESDVKSADPSCEKCNISNDKPLDADDNKENSSVPQRLSASERVVEEDQKPAGKEKDTFMMLEDEYSEDSSAPESLSVSEDEGDEDHLDGGTQEEKDKMCVVKDGQHAQTPSGSLENQTSSQSKRKEKLDDEARKDVCLEEEDRYSNVSSLQDQNEGTIITERLEEMYSLSQGSIDSLGINTTNVQDAANKLSDNTCALEYQDSVRDNDSNDAGDDFENGSTGFSGICGLDLGNTNQTCLEFPENRSLKTRFQKIVGSGTQTTNSTCVKSERDSICPIQSKEDRSSFDFLERCLGLTNSGIEQKSCIENEWLRPMDESDVLSCLKEGQASRQNIMHPIEAPDHVRTGLENVKKPIQKVFTGDEQEPLVLSECYSEPLSFEDSVSYPKDNQEKGENGFIHSSEFHHKEGDSSVDNIEDEMVFEDQAVRLKSSLSMRKRLHPIVILKTSKLKNVSNGFYYCTECQKTTESIDHLIEHHHSNHSENKFHFCQSCGTFLTHDIVTKRHQCGVIGENTPRTSNTKLQKVKSTGHDFHKCRYCRQTFHRLCDYNKHVQSHSAKTEHKCKRCGAYFSQRGNLNRHISTKRCRRSQDPLKKQIGKTPQDPCKKTIDTAPPDLLKPQIDTAPQEPRKKTIDTTPQELLKQQIDTTPQDPSKKTIDTTPQDILKQQIDMTPQNPVKKRIDTIPHNRNHKTGTVNPNGLPPDSPYANLPDCFVKLVDICNEHVCRLCGKSFATSAKLYKHGYNVHHTKTRSHNIRSKFQNTNRFKCQTCQMTFSNSSNFSRHKRRCNGAETCKCPLCPRLFKYSNNRFRHLREQCIKDYIQGSSGKVNMKFRCPFCTTTFSNASNRHRHIRLVCLKEYMHNETSRTKAERQKVVEPKGKNTNPRIKKALNQSKWGFKCNYCPSVYAYSSGRYRHMRKHTLLENPGKKVQFRYSNLAPISKQSKESVEEPKNNPLSSEVSIQHFPCCFCGKMFNAKYPLKKHIHSMHRGDKPYRCLECGKRFSKEVYLVTHKKVHQRRIQCTVCKKILPTIGELIQHRQTHIKRGMLQCPDCPSQFQYPVYLLRHMASHHKLKQERPLKEKQNSHSPIAQPLESLPSIKETEKELGCPLCPEVLPSASELSSHCLNHLSESSSSRCPFCKRHFSARTSLVRHIRIHTGEKPFTCLSCGTPFHRKEYLLLHHEKCAQRKQAINTSKESEDVSSKSLVTSIKKVYKCSYCPREFEKVPRLLTHHNGHMQNTVIPCPKCGKCYRHKRKLHERLCKGSNVKPTESVGTILHPCRNCGRKFSKDYNRNVHERTCNTVKRMQENTSSGNSKMHFCRNCGKYFTRSDDYNVHEKTCNFDKLLQKRTTEIRTSSRDKLQHKCPHCPSKFRYRSYLLRHIGSHTGEKSYPCMHCGHSYTTQSRCLQHEAFCDGVNRQKPPSASVREVEGEYKCNICTKTFMKSRNLRRHILTHTDVKPYRCKACDSCFSRHDHLKLHQSRCKGKRQRLEVRIAKISLADVGRGWQNNLDNTDSEKKPLFYCSICSKSFPTHSNMARHNAMLHAVRTVGCNHCGSSFTHEKSLKRHKSVGACQRMFAKTQHSETQNVISPPSRETNRLLQRIQLQYKDKRKFKCTFCPRLFKSGEQLRVHTRLHTGEKPFGCASCGERFIRRDYLQRHLNKCKGETLDTVLCDRCGDVFSQDKLGNHQQTCVIKSKSPACSRNDSTARSPPKGFSCANCSSRFLLFSQLQEHFLNTHSEETTSPDSSLQEQLSSKVNIKEEPVDEEYGDTQQSDNVLLDQDCDIHNDMMKPIECPQCNMHFGNKGGFARHMHTHLGQHPFNCKKCKKGFWNKNFYRTHIRKCRLMGINREGQTDTLITSEMDPALKETVLVFNQGSKTTGTGVLQTNFSCKDDLKDLTLQNFSGNQGKGSSSTERKNSGQQIPGNKYQCSECDKSFTDGLLLISHLEDHGREELERKKKSCQKCGKTFANLADLARHTRVHWNEKTYSCPECPQTFHYSSDLDIHRTCHDPNRPFVCKECQQRFWTSQSLENHQSQAHPKELIYTCHVCNKNYSIRSSLVKHIRMKHQTEKKVNVDRFVKEKEAVVQDDFDMEVDEDGESNANNDEDENDASEDNDSDSADYFPCHVCGKTFTTSESLEDHQRCHLGEKPHECAECGKCFFQAGQLQQHLRSHKSEYQCQTCGRGFVSLFALRKHKHTHGKSRQHRCSKCPLSFRGPSQLAEHMASHRDDNFPCDICDRTFSCKISRAEHRKIHTETDDVPPLLLQPERKTASPSPTATAIEQLKYRCGVCNERFKDPEQLSEHGCMAARERPYTCQECNKHFLHASHLNKHQLSHYQLPQSYVYRCNQCRMNFNYRHNFVSHLKTHGDDEAAAETLKGVSVTHSGETDAEKRTIYKCPICPHRFAHALELASHLSVHSENMNTCSVCDLTFPTKSKLAEHERSHLTPATQYECTECGKSFLGSDPFRQHHCAHRQSAVTDHEHPNSSSRTSMEEEEEVDVGEDFFNCTVCLKRFSSSGSLQEHLNKEHPNERPFKCQSCGKAFTLKRYLRDHERRQHKFGTERAQPSFKSTDTESQYKCSVCPKTLTSSHSLSLHMKVHTEQESGGEHRCDMCYKSFNRLSLLRQHQESHVGQVVYECTECDKAFAFPHLLEEHQKTHAAGP